MDIDHIFTSPFHRAAQSLNTQILQWPIKPISKFPLTKFITDGDEFFRCVWKSIDDSKDYFWMTTYAMDSSPVADTTLFKLIEAAKRGVHVVLFLDNVQSWAKKEMTDELVKAGGKFMILNPQFEAKSIKKYFTKDVWRRHHEKLIVSDEKSIIGSSNMEGSYAGIRYGTSIFRDINLYSENIILDQYRKHFIDTANFYHFDLELGQEAPNFAHHNQHLLTKYDRHYTNSQLYPIGKYKLLHNHQKKKIKDIENDVVQRLKNATLEVKVVQPYHYTMSKFDRMVNRLVSVSGIKPEIITSGKRDQPVFQEMTNEMLFERLLRKGIKLFETKQGLLHSKIYMFDRRWVNMGSMNNDRWSWAINNECNILIDDPRVYEEVEKYYQELRSTCREVKRGYQITADQAVSIGFWQWFLYLSEIVMSQSGRPEEDYIVHSRTDRPIAEESSNHQE